MEAERISITFFQNPFRFLYKSLEPSQVLIDTTNLLAISKELNKFKRNRPFDSEYVPKINDYVVFYDAYHGHNVRARIDGFMEKEKQYVIWCTDFGKPQLVHRDDIILLDDRELIARQGVEIRTGKLSNCMPKISGSSNSYRKHVEWSQEAVNFFKQSIRDADVLYFAVTKKSEAGYCGDVFVEKDEQRESMTDVLIKLDFAETLPSKSTECNHAEMEVELSKSSSKSSTISNSSTPSMLSTDGNSPSKEYGYQEFKNSSSSTASPEKEMHLYSNKHTVTAISDKNKSRNKSQQSYPRAGSVVNDDSSNPRTFNTRQIFVHGFGATFPPLHSLNDAHFFSEDIKHELLELPILQRTYAYTWRHLSRGNSLILTDDSADREYSYLPVVWERFEEYREQSRGNGPKVVIICATKFRGSQIARIIHKFLADKEIDSDVLEAYNFNEADNLKNSLIFITTIQCYFAIAKSEGYEKYVRHVNQYIIEEFDYSHDNYNFDSRELLRVINYQRADVQIIIISSEWRSVLNKIFQKLRNAMLIFGPEASLQIFNFFNIESRVEAVENNDLKINRLIEMVREQTGGTIVACEHIEDVRAICVAFEAKAIEYVALTENANPQEIASSKEFLKSRSEHVVVATGSALWTNEISCGLHIINFTLPFKLVDLSKRYATCIDAFEKHKSGVGKPPSSTFLLSLDDFKKGYDKNGMKNFLRGILKAWYALPKKSKSKSERNNMDALCSNWLMLGKCNDMHNCLMRHELKELGQCQDQFKPSWKIKFEIQIVNSPVSYSVRIVGDRKNDQCQWSPTRNAFLEQFETTYRKQVRVGFHELKAGHLGVVFYNDKPHRIKIQSIQDYMCKVSFLDITREAYYKLCDVQVLMQKYENIPSDELFIAALLPMDGTLSWKQSVTKDVEDYLKCKRKDNDHFEATVLLHTKDLILVEDVSRITPAHWLPSKKLTYSVRTYLLSSHAKLNYEAFNMITKQCKGTSVSEPNNPDSIEARHASKYKEQIVRPNSFPFQRSSCDSLIDEKKTDTEPEINRVEIGSVKLDTRQQFDSDASDIFKNKNKHLIAKRSSSSSSSLEKEGDELEDFLTMEFSRNCKKIKSRQLPGQRAMMHFNRKNENIPLFTRKAIPDSGNSKDLVDTNGEKPFTKLLTASLSNDADSCKKNQSPKVSSDVDGSNARTSSTNTSSVDTYEAVSSDECTPLKSCMQLTSESVMSESNSSNIETSNLSSPLSNNEFRAKRLRADQAFSPIRTREERSLYAELKFDKWQPVSIGSFFTPNDMYLNHNNQFVKMKHFDFMKSLRELFANTDNLKPLDEIEPKFCLALQSDDYFCRCKILKIACNGDEINYVVRCLDQGFLETCSMNNVYELPEKFKFHHIFQAIPCRLAGIRPSGTETWDSQICDKIYDEILETYTHLWAFPVRLPSANTANSYNVILVDYKDDEITNINEMIVKEGYAQMDEETKYFLTESDINILRDTISSASLNGKNGKSASISSESEDWDLLGSEEKYEWKPPLPSPSDAKLEVNDDLAAFINLLDGDEQADEFIEALMVKNHIKPRREEPESISAAVVKPLSMLKYTTKLPKVVWDQTVNQLILTVSATDVTKYTLEVKNKSVQIAYLKDNELYRAVMTLFGPVNTEHVHHEIRGLNIIIKLMKLITFHNWPRLLERKDSNYWLSYKFDSITKNKCESYKPHSQRMNMFKRAGSHTTSESGESSASDDWSKFIEMDAL